MNWDWAVWLALIFLLGDNLFLRSQIRQLKKDRARALSANRSNT